MDKMQIISLLAQECRVEEAVKSLSHTHCLSQELKDLCQNIYLRLLEYPDYMIEDLWSHPAHYGPLSQMDCFILGIVRNQLSPTGQYGHQQVVQARFVSITGKDWIDNDTAQ